MAPRKTPGVMLRVNSDGSRSYRIRWRQGGGSGLQSSHTFTRQAEALDMLAKIKANGNVCNCPEHSPDAQHPGGNEGHRGEGGQGWHFPGDRPASSGYTLGEAINEHAANLTGIGEYYRRRYVRDLERHLRPFLDRPLDSITADDVRRWLRGCETGEHPWLLRRVSDVDDEYVPTPLSVKTTRRILVQAGAIYRQRGIGPNPFAGHRLGQDTEEHALRALTPEQWRLVEEEVPEGTYRDLCRFLLGAGARWGEATALTVGDVDPFAGTVRIRRAWKGDGANGFVLGAPKSRRSRRTIDLDPTTMDVLLPYLAGRSPDELLFTTSRGKPIRAANFSHRVWLPAVRRAQEKGLPFRPRIHDLRHTCASWLISGGVSPLMVSQQLGHESFQITLDLYSHVMPRDQDRATAVMAAALAPANRVASPAST